MKKLSEMYRATPPSELRKLPSKVRAVPPPSDQEKLENRKRLTLARKHGFPRPLPVTGYQVYIHEQLTGNKGLGLKAMTSKLSDASKAWKGLPDRSKEQYATQAMENKLSHLRNLKTWSEEQGIPFSKRTSVLLSRFYVKYQKGLTTGAKEASKKDAPK
ncbi:hypothetical protein Aperf_G00000114510 [Anoplocephala perfoliata]